MKLEVRTKVKCPHCGRKLVIALDLAEPEGSWLADCEVCHKPISFTSHLQTGAAAVTAEQARA